jgi:hypothetical protein
MGEAKESILVFVKKQRIGKKNSSPDQETAHQPTKITPPHELAVYLPTNAIEQKCLDRS